MSLEAKAQVDEIYRTQASHTFPVQTEQRNALSFLMLAWEHSPRTHLYTGFRRGTLRTVGQAVFEGDRTQFFIKAAYELSP